jgi:hypothetical protein
MTSQDTDIFLHMDPRMKTSTNMIVWTPPTTKVSIFRAALRIVCSWLAPVRGIS